MNQKRNGNRIAEAFRYLKESKIQIYAIIGIFIFGILAGFVFPKYFTFLNPTLKGLSNEVSGMGGFELFRFIFFNNGLNAFIGIIFGAIFGLLPVLSALLNGVLIGYVGKAVVDTNGFLGLWKILPHGIFELPAILISLGIGLRLGVMSLSKGGRKELKKGIINSIILFFCLIIPLLLIAAIIESLLIVFIK